MMVRDIQNFRKIIEAQLNLTRISPVVAKRTWDVGRIRGKSCPQREDVDVLASVLIVL